MYWRRSESSLSRAELEAARLGFLGCLRRKRFSPHFIEGNADDLLGQACVEYSRKLNEGETIDNPPGWLIECAWRRTKSRLEAERSGPRVVSTEKTEPIADDADAGPEDLLMNAERWRKVRRAVAELSPEQQTVLVASYFEGLPVREAARKLRWHPSKAQRAHEAARKRLHDLLGVKSSDELQVEIGLAAYISSVASEPSAGMVQRAAESLASLKQQVFESGATLKQQTAATSVRVVEATPTVASMRPGTTLAVLGTCAVGLVSGVTYCAEKGVSPIGTARDVLASAEETEAPEITEPPSETPVYTPVEPPPAPEQPVPEQAAAPPAEEAPAAKPKPEPPPPPAPEESFEPVAQPAPEVEPEPVESYESPAPVESSGAAPAATSSSQEFEP